MQEPSSWQSPNEKLTMEPTTLLEGLQSFQSVIGGFSFPSAALPTTCILEQPSSADPLEDAINFTSIPTDFEVEKFALSRPSINDWLSSAQSELPSCFSDTPAFQMSELMKADLNHLYFDRVHLFAPILNSRRYFARAARPLSATPPFVGLQHAMWTLAAWLGSQFKEIQKSLYTHTRALLEEWELDIITESPSIELAQAWLFLAIYEIMQVNYDRGWLSAGRCFRLVQLMKLHEVDAPNGATESNFSYVEIEEQRRTFWIAYSLDRFINLINYMPLTLNEQVVSHRSMYNILVRSWLTRITDPDSLASSRSSFST